MNEMNKKIDLKNELMKEFRTRDLVENSGTESVLKYFLTEDLTAILGKTEFDAPTNQGKKGEETIGEIEMTRTRDGFYISTIFGTHYRVIFRYNGMDVFEIKMKDGDISRIDTSEKVFEITSGPDNLTNTLKTSVDNEKYEQVYEVNPKDYTFRYKCGTEKREDYSACLMGLNAKFSSYEMLHYLRTTPPIESERSMFKRVAKVFSGNKLDKGEGIISVVTSDSLTELTDYSDRIFQILKNEAEKAKNKVKDRKSLKMQNEEQ